MKTFYSIQDAAAYLQVDYKVVYRLVKEGEIPAARVGWQYRITQEELDTYLNAQRARQAALAGERTGERAGMTTAPAANGNAPAKQTATAARAIGISRVQARQMEQNFINRFQEKVTGIDTIRHPISDKSLRVNDWEPLHETRDERERLMRALNTAFLDRTTLATTPRNVISRYAVKETPDLVIEGRVVAHLETYCQAGADEAPAGIEDLLVVIEEYEQEHQKKGAAFVTGVASPTGWSDEAIAYIHNTGRGDTYRNRFVRLFLVDPRSEAVYYDEHDPTTVSFAGLFILATPGEDIAALQEQLRAEIAGRSGLILSDFARTHGVNTELLLRAARALEAADGYRLVKEKGTDWILITLS